MPPCPTSSATQSTPSGFVLDTVTMTQGASPEQFLYQQEVHVQVMQPFIHSSIIFYNTVHCTVIVSLPERGTYIAYMTFIDFTIYFTTLCITPAPPTPTGVTARLISASSVRVAWQWNSSGPAPHCFNTTTVTYRPEGGGESSLQLSDPTATEVTLSDPAATEATLTDLRCNTNYTVTVVATAGEHRREGVMFLPIQGILNAC